MGKPGRRPVPTKLKIIKGTDEPRRVLKNEPKPADDDIEMPGGLSPAARRHWKKVSAQLVEARMITNMDATALAMYCEAFATWQGAMKQVNKDGPVVEKVQYGRGDLVVTSLIQSPHFMVANKAFDQLRHMTAEFGMTPSSRTRVSTTGDDTDENPFT